MTGKGCKPAVYWLNAFVLDAAEADIGRGPKTRIRGNGT